MATLEAHGIQNFDHAARQVLNRDFEAFDYILAMDGDNLKDLRRKCRRLKKGDNTEKRIALFGDFDYVDQVKGEDIEDPYYGGDYGFEIAYDQCVRFSRGWLRDVLGVEADIDPNGKVTATLAN